MKKKAGVHIGLAVALCGLLPVLNDGYLIALYVVIGILVISAIILYFHSQFHGAFWQWLVRTADSIGIGFTAAGFGCAGPGLSLMKHGWLPLGIILLIVGALLLGVGIGANLWELQKQVSTKAKKK
ncbi:MAG: hypothetical protein PVJ61_08100 [Dehalococcoidia bacterium]|jgi:hypothetical protein